MTPATSGRYGGVDAAERVASRRARLLDAALDLLGTVGRRATTVRAICERARLTPRYFYESFPDLEAVLLALFDEISSEAAAVVLAAVAQAPEDARAKSRAAIEAFVELITDDPRKGRILFSEATGFETLAERRFQTLRMFAGLVGEQAQRFYGMADPPGALVETSSLMLAGGLAETLLAWLDGNLSTTRDQLIEDCAELFAATGEAAVRLARERAAREPKG